VAALQIHRWAAYAAVETSQEEGTGGKGAAEVSRTRAQDHWAWCNSAPERRVNAGVEAHAVAAKTETVQYRGSLPDILAYLQNETELTRSTLVRILKESGRLSEFFVNPQRFMDSDAAILKSELHQLIVDGIKYERIPTTESEFEWASGAIQERRTHQLFDGATSEPLNLRIRRL